MILELVDARTMSILCVSVPAFRKLSDAWVMPCVPLPLRRVPGSDSHKSEYIPSANLLLRRVPGSDSHMWEYMLVASYGK